MRDTGLYVNGIDLAATYGVFITAAPNMWDGFASATQSMAIPGAMGEVESSFDAVVPAKEFTVQALLRATSVAGRIAIEDQLNQLFYGGAPVMLVRTDLLTRVRYGKCQAFTITPTAPEWKAVTSKLELKIKCTDPLAYELTPQFLTFGAVRTAMPIGNAPVGPRVLLTGAPTNPVITLRNAAGDPLTTMGFTVTLGAGVILDIDMAGQTVAQIDAAGVRTAQRGYFTSGAYLTLRPADGDPANGIYSTLEVSAGSAIATYKRVWF